MASEDKSTENYTLKNAAIDTAKTFVTHPMSLVKNSIQLGHEPLPAFAGKTWFFKDAQFHVGLVPYGAEIYRKYGVVGLFRGVTPKVGSLLAYNFSRPLRGF